MSWRFWRRSGAGADPGPGDEGWEKALVNRVVMEHVAERRRARRWGILFKVLTFAYLIALLVLLWPEHFLERVVPGDGHTALVDVKGLIAPDTKASAERILSALRKAYEDEDTKGIILRINSPGGSPVQAGYVNAEIQRLREKYPDTPLYAVAADLCASGAYYIAVAADQIYVDKASLVGSIGVRIDAFGFVQTLEDLGVERRLLVAGQNKGILDPFSPMQEPQRVFLQGVLDKLHRQFIDVVRAGRGARLKGGDELFSGLFWSGEESIELGLADGLGSSAYVARELIGAEKIVKFRTKQDLLERLADRLGASIAAVLVRLSRADGYPMLR